MPKSKKVKLSAAELVLKRFGGPRELGRLTGRDPSLFCKWVERRGVVPLDNRKGDKNWHLTLLELAKRERVKLTQHELLEGGYA
jgi:hypothetical protein